jgi:hypothetical protein
MWYALALMALALGLGCGGDVIVAGSSGESCEEERCTCAVDCEAMQGIVTGCYETGEPCPPEWGTLGVWVCGEPVKRDQTPTCNGIPGQCS